MKNKVKIVFAVASISFCVLLYLVLTVAVSGLLAAFPQYSADTVMLVLTLPSISALGGVLGVPLLLRRFSHKSVAILSLLCLTAGGLLCLLFDRSLAVLIAASLLMGLPYGSLSTLYPLLVKKYFTQEEGPTVIGIAACTMQLGCLISKFIGGYLADIHWSYVYFTYGFAVLALLVVCLGLPREPRPAPAAGGERLRLTALKNRRIWVFGAIAFVFPVLYFIISTHASLYVEGYGLGTAAMTGNLSALGAGAAALLSLLFARIVKVTKKRSFETAYFLIGAGYLFAGLRVSVLGIVVAMLAGAAGISLFTPYLISCITMDAKAEDASVVTAFVLTVVNLAYFASPYLNNWCSRLLSDGSPASVFTISGVSALVCTVILLFLKEKDHVQ